MTKIEVRACDRVGYGGFRQRGRLSGNGQEGLHHRAGGRHQPPAVCAELARTDARANREGRRTLIARGGRTATLEGPAARSRVVIIEFPSFERAQAVLQLARCPWPPGNSARAPRGRNLSFVEGS